MLEDLLAIYILIVTCPFKFKQISKSECSTTLFLMIWYSCWVLEHVNFKVIFWIRIVFAFWIYFYNLLYCTVLSLRFCLLLIERSFCLKVSPGHSSCFSKIAWVSHVWLIYSQVKTISFWFEQKYKPCMFLKNVQNFM